ncbi:hypothetical protein SDC9_173001 [bioreactor metagenome]|uniref:Uncharacterized protein n=1 Tax=bioreactor metagenome TaxID=1076179 RepID=A0A645GIG5_9ZZZZ
MTHLCDLVHHPDHGGRVLRKEEYGIHITGAHIHVIDYAPEARIADHQPSLPQTVHHPFRMERRDVGPSAGADYHSI